MYGGVRVYLYCCIIRIVNILYLRAMYIPVYRGVCTYVLLKLYTNYE